MTSHRRATQLSFVPAAPKPQNPNFLFIEILINYFFVKTMAKNILKEGQVEYSIGKCIWNQTENKWSQINTHE